MRKSVFWHRWISEQEQFLFILSFFSSHRYILIRKTEYTHISILVLHFEQWLFEILNVYFLLTHFKRFHLKRSNFCYFN